MTAADLIARIDDALAGGARVRLVDHASRLQPFSRALAETRQWLATHRLKAPGVNCDWRDLVDSLDRQTRREGFHVLHEWDGKALRVVNASIVVSVLDFLAARRGNEPTDRGALAILVDYYFVYLLALAAMRAWDTPDPSATLGRVTSVLAQLHGDESSGQRFADDAEMLLLIATSHYEPEEDGFRLWLERVRELPRERRVTVAMQHAHAMGAHLRYAYEITTAKSIPGTREDNVADYPWLRWSLLTLIEEFDRLSADPGASSMLASIAEALANGLVPDPAAFVGADAARLAPRPDTERIIELFGRHRPALVESFAAHRPLDRAYSPLSLFFNFSQNLLKGAVIDALVMGEAWGLSLNDMFTALPAGHAKHAGKERLARTVMAYAKMSPDIVSGRPVPAVVYDPVTARRSFAAAMKVLAASEAV
ncbi:MAG TPA: hypothetical protein VFV78_10065 [Vicinamibacterales bacterium]|nr:hypothetical protein [Vicinamibacterales bacterium]